MRKLKPSHVTGLLPREQSCLVKERSRKWSKNQEQSLAGTISGELSGDAEGGCGKVGFD